MNDDKPEYPVFVVKCKRCGRIVRDEWRYLPPGYKIPKLGICDDCLLPEDTRGPEKPLAVLAKTEAAINATEHQLPH